MLKITKILNHGVIHFKTSKGYFFGVSGDYDSVISFYKKDNKGNFFWVADTFGRLPYRKRRGEILNTKERLKDLRLIIEHVEENKGCVIL